MPPIKKPKGVRPIKAWMIMSDESKPLDILFYKPGKYSYFNIGGWRYPVEDSQCIPVLITPIKKKNKVIKEDFI